MRIKAYARLSAKTVFEPFSIERCAPGPRDVSIDIMYCGVCHTDVHIARSEWPGTMYPCVPGHEIVGRVTAVGSEVERLKAGDAVGVGCMVASCGICPSCRDGLEQYCERDGGFIGTYNGPARGPGENTYGGYSAAITVDEHFVFAIRHPPSQLAAVAPLMCAGITSWSPLRHWRVGKGHKVGIVGIGGLGHMAIKLAHGLGAHVVAFTTSPAKRDDAISSGAAEVIISKNANERAHHAGSFDFILDTVSASHDLDELVILLKRDGALTLLGAPTTPHPSPSVANLLLGRRSIAGSLIGSVSETQEMLDFCAEHRIFSDIEMIDVRDIESAYDRLLRSDVRYRFVIDMKSLKTSA